MTDRFCLHYAPDNASLIIRLVLEELGLPYSTALVDRSRRAQDSADYRKLNPSGLIPVLETPDGPIFETAAILLWLTDRTARLAPGPEDAQRAAYLKWLFFASNTLHADLRLLFYPEYYVDADQIEHLRSGVRARLRQHLSLLNDLARQNTPWFSPDQPSSLTYYVACMLRWMELYPQNSSRGWHNQADTPYLQRIAASLESRPATRAAVVAEGLGATPFTSPIYAIPPEGTAT